MFIKNLRTKSKSWYHNRVIKRAKVINWDFANPAVWIRNESGFSIIEILISIALLSIVMIITTQTLTSSLKNSKKSDSISKTRENVDYALSTMERLLRNAQSVSCSANGRSVDYVDEYGNSTSFQCNNAGGFIASGSAFTRLTSTDVNVICDDPAATPFQCPSTGAGIPDTVVITLMAEEADLGGSIEGAVITASTKVLLRNYTVF